MATFEVLADWMQTGIEHRDARPGDAANLFGIVADNLDNMERQVTGSGSFIAGAEFDDYDKLSYGHVYRSWLTGTNVNAAVNVGYDGATYDLAAQAAGTYTAIIWLFSSNASYDTVPLVIRLKSSAGTVATSASFFVTEAEGWKQVSVSGTTVSSLQLYIEVAKNNDATSAGFRVTAPMIVAGSVAPAGYNVGTPSTYDNISAYTMEADWSGGFRQQYRHLCDAGRANFILRDEEAIFCPENSASPLYGYLTARKRVNVWVDNDATLTVPLRKWWGFISAIKPTATLKTAPVCKLECIDLRGLAEGRTVRTTVLTDVTAKEVAEAVYGLLDLPTDTIVGPIYTPPPAPPNPSWAEVYAYALEASNEDEADAIRIIADCAGAMQAKLAFSMSNRQAVLLWRYIHEFTAATPAITLDGARLQDAAYQYGASLINDCTVVARKRKASVATDKILYTLDEALTVEPLDSETIRVRYKDTDLEDRQTVGGLNVYLDTTADAGLDITIEEEFANGCEILVDNPDGPAKTVTELLVRGTKLTSWGESEHRATNAASIASYGVAAELLDYRLPASRPKARRMAEYRVDRFGEPFGEITSVTLKTLNGDDDLKEAMLTLGLFSKITIDTSTRNGHSADYVIIGEEHRLDSGLGGQVDGGIGGYTVVWTVEKIYPFFILDNDTYGELDGIGKLAYY